MLTVIKLIELFFKKRLGLRSPEDNHGAQNYLKIERLKSAGNEAICTSVNQ
jgi:hypothetical protein